jgi:hypothetical protein
MATGDDSESEQAIPTAVSAAPMASVSRRGSLVFIRKS